VRKDINENSFDMQALRRELKNAGFEEFITDNIVTRVVKRSATGWTKNDGYSESIREVQLILNSTKTALQNFKENTGVKPTEIPQASY
jgi:hypothetical protein